MSTTTMTKKASQKLYDEVIMSGLCTLCGACIGACPYFKVNPRRGKIRRIDICDRDEGQCYQYCPRTYTDVDAIYRKIFGVPYGEDEIGVGVIKDAFLARTTDSDIQSKAQDGGSVTTLLLAALQAGMVDAVIETKMSADKSPGGFIARNKEELLSCAGNSYESGAALETLNSVPPDSQEKLAIVGLPCQIAAVAKMKAEPPRNRFNIDNVKLVVGLFCGWSLTPGSFHEFLEQNYDLSQIVKFDIPHHPGHTFDLYMKSGKKEEIEIEDVRQFINESCSYCCDMTAQFADVSVGSGRAAFRGWNTVIVRTEAGAKVVELAKKKGALETQPIPPENLVHLKKSAINKMKTNIQNLMKLSGSEQDLRYLGIKNQTLDKILQG